MTLLDSIAEIFVKTTKKCVCAVLHRDDMVAIYRMARG